MEENKFNNVIMDIPARNENKLFGFLSWLLIGIGVILRLAQYFYDKSLWRDETLLVLNIIERSTIDLLKPLDYNQHAPPGFLIIEKIITSLLGTGELAFRFFPLICSIVSLFFFYKLSKKCISKSATLIALGIFAILVSMLYYSSETKQYSSDVLISLLLVLLTLKIKNTDLTVLTSLLYGIYGAISIWFSHTAILVLIGSSLYFLLKSISKKELQKSFYVLIFCLPWVISFLVLYFTILVHTDTDKGLSMYWDNFYFPLPNFSASTINTYKTIYSEFLRFSTLNSFAGICFVIGFTVFYKNQKETFYILGAPLFVTLFVSALHKYPLFERFLLFLIPFIILFIAEGAEWLRQKASKISPILGIVIICLLFYKPLLFTKNNFTNPLSQEEIKPVLSYIKDHLKKNDVIYVSGNLQYVFKYYAPRYNLCSNYSIKPERENLEEAQCSSFNHKLFLGSVLNNTDNELEKISRSKRIWFIFSDKLEGDRAGKRFTLSYLDNIGVKIGSFLRPNISAYLYDLSIKSDNK